jgi:murein DD-endopeptidase MepM/ murein hydrolase activator NlpD
MNLGLMLGAVGVVVLAASSRSKSKGRRSLTSNRGVLTDPKAGLTQIKLPPSDWPDPVFSIPFGSGTSAPIWPIVTSHSSRFTVSYRTLGGKIIGNGARRFMAKRGDAKYHVGIDVYARHGDPVVACESGQIVNLYHFYHGAYAMIVQCDTGLVINYGEIAKNSWKEFGLAEGARIKKGQPIARIGTMSGGSSMLHFETYMRPSRTNERYFGGDAGPILNPTYYLLRARAFTQAGRAYSGSATCRARAFQNMPPTSSFEEEIALEERALNVEPTDSVLAELNADKFRDANDPPNRADGP